MATITGSDFINRLKCGTGIPTGPHDPFDPARPDDPRLYVRDIVDLRGQTVRASRFAYGVVFHGTVDLRELNVQGTLDLSHCIFEQELLLDDAEIEGMLNLDFISARSLKMVGIVVRGRLGLNTAWIDSPVQIYDGLVEGSLDMRGLSAPSVLLRGLRI